MESDWKTERALVKGTLEMLNIWLVWMEPLLNDWSQFRSNALIKWCSGNQERLQTTTDRFQSLLLPSDPQLEIFFTKRRLESPNFEASSRYCVNGNLVRRPFFAPYEDLLSTSTAEVLSVFQNHFVWTLSEVQTINHRRWSEKRA